MLERRQALIARLKSATETQCFGLLKEEKNGVVSYCAEGISMLLYEELTGTQLTWPILSGPDIVDQYFGLCLGGRLEWLNDARRLSFKEIAERMETNPNEFFLPQVEILDNPLLDVVR